MSVPIEFRDVTLPPLEGLRVQAPAGVIIGITGETGSGIEQLLNLASRTERPVQGEVVAREVIVLDRAIVLQDAVAQAREFIRLDELRRAGSTILLPSNDDRLLEQLCDEVWWIDGGRLAAKGDSKETLAKYRKHVADRIRSWGGTMPTRLAPTRLAPSFRRGDGRAEVLSIETLGAGGEPTIIWKSGEEVRVRATIRFHEAVSDPVFGIMIRTQIGFEVYGTNTELERVKIGPCAGGDVRIVTFSFRCGLCPKAYTLTLASHDPDGTAHDWLEDAVAVTVTDDRYTAGVANLRATVIVER
jgi:ABC-type methionine transport system ATPase subunit